jgi:catechol 2,3-dioxygenase-like lactoylglutathione lyase family enzyme
MAWNAKGFQAAGRFSFRGDTMKAIGLLLGLFLPVAIQGQPATVIERPFGSASGAFFALSVADLRASSRWYSEKLGLKVVAEIPKQDKAAVVVLEGGGLLVELIQLDGALPLNKVSPDLAGAQSIHGIFKAGLFVEDFEGTVTRLRSRGVEIAYGPFPARGNQRANVVIRDNAGNLLQFFGK